jgi:hypothetical protein
MARSEILDKGNWRLKDNFGNINNILTSHEKGLLLSCVEAVIDKYNQLGVEPLKYPKVQERAAELRKLLSKIRYKL